MCVFVEAPPFCGLKGTNPKNTHNVSRFSKKRPPTQATQNKTIEDELGTCGVPLAPTGAKGHGIAQQGLAGVDVESALLRFSFFERFEVRSGSDPRFGK